MKKLHYILAFGLCTLLTASGVQPVFAQGFLEKLEKAVRSQVEETSTAASEELPAPQQAPRQVPSTPKNPKTNAVPNSVPNAVPAPNGTPKVSSPSGTSAQDRPTGGIYLGLEAEDNSGIGIGVRVAAVAPQSPAWKAGFEVGDRIVAINGFAVARLDDMVSQLSKTSPRQSVRFLINRGGRSMQLTAVLMDANLASRTVGIPSESPPAGEPFLGLTVNDLTSSFRRQFGISVFRGAAVSGVASGSPAQLAGIRPGDAIVEAGGVPIQSSTDLLRWMATTQPGQPVALRVYRGGFARSVELLVGAKGRVAAARPPIPAPDSPLASGVPVVPPALETAPLSSANLITPSDARPATVSPPSILESGEPNQLQNPIPSGNELETELARLRSENAKLQTELKQTQTQLKETKQKLEQILELVKNR